MGDYIVSRVQEDFGSIKGKNVQIIGVAYKSNISDTRETPAIEVNEALSKAGAIVSWHDPLVDKWNGADSSNLGAEIGIVVTKHDAIDTKDIMSNFNYVFDATGKVNGAVQL